MLVHGDKIFAHPGYYLQCSDGGAGLTLPFHTDVVEIELPDTVEKSGELFLIGGRYLVKLNETTKKRLIHLLWSNDDQIAVILNKEEEPEMFDLMQGWRAWFSKVIKKMKEF